MKWSLAALIALGLLAGLCAALLVISLKAPPEETAGATGNEVQAPRPIKVLVASTDLAASDLVVARSIGFKEVLSDAAPAGAFSDAIQIIGKVLLVPMTEGQPFTPACFAGDTDRLRLASALAPGKRAVCLTLEDPSGIERILYPGAIVDVLSTMKPEVDGGDAPTISFTLLQNVLLLAVGSKTIVTPSVLPEGLDTSGSDATITLLVNTDEAEKLRLAMATGKVSLVMRNPMDSASVKVTGVRRGSLAPMLDSFEDRDRKARERREQEDQAKVNAESKRVADEQERRRLELEKARFETELARERYEQEVEKLRVQKLVEVAPFWETEILRGGVAATKSFPILEERR